MRLNPIKSHLKPKARRRSLSKRKNLLLNRRLKRETKAAEKQEEPNAEKSKDDDFIKVKTEKIDGPKVLGKIELPVEKPKKKTSSLE